LSLRQLCNVTYAFLAEGLDPDGRDTLNRRLEEKFDHEMTREERRRAEARRMLEAKGQFGKDEQLRASMGTQRPVKRPNV